MPLPDHLLRTYRRYKEAEHDLLNWICATAPTTSVPISYSEEHQKPAKLKGRARTKARRAAAKDATPPAPPATSLLDIIPSVKAIANDPTITRISAEIVTTFKTILHLRQHCVAWFRGNTNQNDRETIGANKRHLYPISILQQAFRLLKRKIEREHEEAPSKNIRSDQEMSTDKSSNILDLLEVEETLHEIDDLDQESVRPSPQSLPKPTKEERMQDEFNLAMYCLHADIQELEDYIVLELVRYTVDQKNADTLPFLINTAIDQALYMSNEICKLIHNPWTVRDNFAIFDHKKEAASRATSSLKRMQGLIGMEMLWRAAERGLSAKIARENGGRGLQYGRLPFPYDDNDMQYLKTSDKERWWIESRFLHTCWTEDSPKNAEHFRPFYLDSMLKCIHELKHCSANWRDGVRSGYISIGAVFGMRLLLLTTIIIGERKMPAHDKLLETTVRSFVKMQQWKKMEGTLKN